MSSLSSSIMTEVIPNESTLRAFSVSELSFCLKRTLEETFTYVRVKGEISGCKIHSSGHVYFSLKDDQALIDAVCWKGTAEAFSVKPQDGVEVICTGKITTYPGRSKYQIVIASMEISGAGTLLKLLEDRKKKLFAEGLFDQIRKKPLPFLPQIIGVVTSPTGAVIRDILHRLADRMPTHVILWPVAVQGQKAHLEIAAAIQGFNALALKPDLLIVARGGGSLEDLWSFNEEEVVRATAASQIPIISAVGHETDTTLIDYAADKRAPTPTAAAEMAVPVKEDLLIILLSSQKRLINSIYRQLTEVSIRLESLVRGIPQLSKITEVYEQRLDDWAERLKNTIHHYLTLRSNQSESLLRLFDSFSYQNVLKRGFTIIKDLKGTVITHKTEAKPGLSVEITFQDGAQKALIEEGKPLKSSPSKESENSSQLKLWD